VPTLPAPAARHYGRAERRIDRPADATGPAYVVIGVVYDPSRIPGPRLEELFDAKLTGTWDAAQNQRRLTVSGAGAVWDPWEAVAQLEADHPGDILPHPALKLPARLRYPRWYPTDEERRKLDAEQLSKAKAAHILETGDWAVDGEGA